MYTGRQTERPYTDGDTGTTSIGNRKHGDSTGLSVLNLNRVNRIHTECQS